MKPKITKEVLDSAYEVTAPPRQEQADKKLMGRMVSAMRQARTDCLRKDSEDDTRDMFRSLYLLYRMALKTHIDTGADVIDVYD